MTTHKDNPLKKALNSAGKNEASSLPNKNIETYKNIKSREGKRMIAAYCSPEIHKSLKIIAVQNDTSIQEIVHEAIVNYIKDKKSNAAILD